jgi:hypothetical protein
VDLQVSLAEFSGYFIQEWPDLVFWERHDPGDNPARSLGILVPERAQKNAGLVWSEYRRRATDANRSGGDHGLAKVWENFRMDWLRSEDLKEEKNVTFPAVIIAGTSDQN